MTETVALVLWHSELVWNVDMLGHLNFSYSVALPFARSDGSEGVGSSGGGGGCGGGKRKWNLFAKSPSCLVQDLVLGASGYVKEGKAIRTNS